MFFYRCYGKRILDLLISLIAIIILLPVFIIVAILIKIKLGSPVIFIQKRPGLNEEIFSMYKFRTMTNDKDLNGKLLSDAERLTRFGKVLRSLSIDELPELFNILKGDMSLVGPRPLLIEYLKLYSTEQRVRHSVKPGLTGLAQINGRNSITWEEKFNLDIEYTKKITFIKDVEIIFLTVKKVLIRDGINSNTSETMEKFTGNCSGE